MAKLTHRASALRALSLSLCLLLSPAAARAQAVDPQTALAAQALYEQATAEMDAKSYPSACRKLEEVTRLVPEGLGAKLTLGECYEALGKLASAWSQYALVEALAPKVGQAERAQRAADRAAALKPRLATMTIDVHEAARPIPGLEIRRDGVPVGEAQWGVPLPVDAGAHEVLATAPGRKPWKKQVDVAADGANVSLAVEPLELAPPAAALPVPAPPPVRPEAAPERLWQRPVALVAMGVGVAGVGAGAVLGGLAMAKNGESNEGHCDEADRCDATGVALRHDAVGLGNASTVAMIAGGALLAGGAVLFFTAPSAAAPDRVGAKAARWSARFEILPGGVQVRGAW